MLSITALIVATKLAAWGVAGVMGWVFCEYGRRRRPVTEAEDETDG